MKYFATAAVLMFASVAQAEDRAATSELPAALQALKGAQVISAADAHQVRGKSHRFKGRSGANLFQEMSFSITNGRAKGQVVVAEGAIGTFTFKQFSPQGSLVVEGGFGGLDGSIGVDRRGDLQFSFGGKAVQQQFDFIGDFQQNFAQRFRK